MVQSFLTVRSLIVSVAMAGCLMVSPVPAFADEGHGCMMHGHSSDRGHGDADHHGHGAHYLKHLLAHAEEIGLSDEQIAKLKNMHLDVSRSQIRTQADVKVARLELHAVVEDGQAPSADLEAKVQQLKNAEARFLFAAIQARREANRLLTPEQQQKVAALEKREADKHETGGCGGGGMGRGMRRGMMGAEGSGGHSEHAEGPGMQRQHRH